MKTVIFCNTFSYAVSILKDLGAVCVCDYFNYTMYNKGKTYKDCLQSPADKVNVRRDVW